MLRIHRALKSNACPNATSLARDLEVSTKSIHRDLEFMQDRLRLPIEYDAAPPYVGGHPDRTPAAITAGLKARIYDAAAARMEQAFGG